MQRTLRLALAAFLLATPTLLSAAEQRSNYKEATGRVVDARGAPVAGATVAAPWGGGDPATTAPVLTDEKGNFTLSIRANSYGLHILATAGDRMGIARAPGSKKEEPIKLLIELVETKAIEVAVQDELGHAVSAAEVNVNIDQPPDLAYVELQPAKTGADGKATIRIPVEAMCRGICARSPDGQLAGIVATGPDDTQATIKIQPLGGLAGQFVDLAGQPVISQRIYYGPLVRDNDETFPWTRCFGGNQTSDEDGNFELRGLVVGARYRILDAQQHKTVTLATVDAPTIKQLGKLKLQSVSSAPTADQQIAQALLGDPIEKYAKARRDAASYRQRVAIIFVDPKSAATRQLIDLRTRYKNVRQAMDDFSLVFVDATGEPAKELIRSLDVKLADSDAWPQIVVRDPDGRAVAQAGNADFSVDGQIDRNELIDRNQLIDWCHANALEPLDAKKLLDDALAAARATNRRVLVQQTAVWCGPCHLLATYLEGQHEIWDKDYLWIQIDERWTHHKEVIGNIRTPASGIGIPWLAVLDADGRVLNTFVGYPGTPTGAEKFLTLLKETSQRLSDDDLARLRPTGEEISPAIVAAERWLGAGR